MFWPLKQAVFGFAASLPENNCLASPRTSAGFPPMTEIPGVPAYNPNFGLIVKSTDLFGLRPNFANRVSASTSVESRPERGKHFCI
jgi:hypothetical protein